MLTRADALTDVNPLQRGTLSDARASPLSAGETPLARGAPFGVAHSAALSDRSDPLEARSVPRVHLKGVLDGLKVVIGTYFEKNHRITYFINM